MASSVHEQIIEILTRESDLLRISDSWRRLLQRCPYASPFQSPDWLIPWWKHFGVGKLLTPVIHDAEELAAIAPWYIHAAPDGVTRQVSFIGIGISDYLDVLIGHKAIPVDAASLIRTLEKFREHWDECDFFGLRSGSPLLMATASPALRAEIEPHIPCPLVSLPTTFPDYLGSLASVHRRKALRECRILEEQGDLYLDLVTIDTLHENMEDFFRLHTAWWYKRGKPGMLADPKVQAFHHEAAEGLQKSGVLKFYRLILNGETVALLYGLLWKKRFYSYLGAFDPEMERYSPGVVILLKVIEKCIMQGVEEFDFMRGQEKYKYLWGAKDRMTWRLRIKR